MALIWCCCGCGIAGSCSSNLPLAWELPYAAGMVPKRKKEKKKKGFAILWILHSSELDIQFSVEASLTATICEIRANEKDLARLSHQIPTL